MGDRAVVSLLPGGVLRGALRGQALPARWSAEIGASGPPVGDAAAGPPVRADSRGAGRPVARLLGTALRARRGAVLPAARAAAKSDARGYYVADGAGGARGRRQEHARGGDGMRLRRYRHRLRDDHRAGHRVHPNGGRAGAGIPDPGAGADRDGGHRPRHGDADHASLHHDGGAARSGGDQARRGNAGGAHVRVLLCDPVCDHAPGGARRLRRCGPGEGEHVGHGLRRHARCGTRLHRPLHVRLRADAAADRQGLGHRMAHRHLVGDLGLDRRHLPRREPVWLAVHARFGLAAGAAFRRGAVPDQAGPDYRCDRTCAACDGSRRAARRAARGKGKAA